MAAGMFGMDGVGFAGRMEVLPEAGGRRVWPLETKLRIVAESYAEGASVGEVARRHGLLANQVTRWRRQYRQGELVPRGSPPLPPMMPARSRGPSHPGEVSLDAAEGSSDLPTFVPLMLEDEAAFADPGAGAPGTMAVSEPPEALLSTGAPEPATGAGAGRIEIEAGGVVVRLPGDVSPARLAQIVSALRGAAAAGPSA